MILFKKKNIAEENIASKLRAAREAKNISLPEAAAKLNIKEDYLFALEKNDRLTLPGGIYEKLFLKKYSSFLGLNSKTTEKEYEQEGLKKNSQTDIFAKKKIEKKHFLVIPKIVRNILLLFGFLLLSYYLVFCLKISLSSPKVEIFFPPENLVTNEKNLEISGRASEKTQITINGQQILKDDSGAFSETVELKTGLNSITIFAKNPYGREQIIQRQILVK